MNNSIHCSFNLPIKNFILADFYQIYYFSKKTSIHKFYNIFRKVGGYGKNDLRVLKLKHLPIKFLAWPCISSILVCSGLEFAYTETNSARGRNKEEGQN